MPNPTATCSHPLSRRVRTAIAGEISERCHECGAYREASIEQVPWYASAKAAALAAAEPERGEVTESRRLSLQGLRSLAESFGRRWKSTRGGVMLTREMAFAIQVELDDKADQIERAQHANRESATLTEDVELDDNDDEEADDDDE